MVAINCRTPFGWDGGTATRLPPHISGQACADKSQDRKCTGALWGPHITGRKGLIYAHTPVPSSNFNSPVVFRLSCVIRRPTSDIQTSKMGRWAYAFRLSKQEVIDAEPPGTVRLVGMLQPCVQEYGTSLASIADFGEQSMRYTVQDLGATNKRIISNCFLPQRGAH